MSAGIYLIFVEERNADVGKRRSNSTRFVRRGANVGTIFLPHKHKDGSYVVSKTRFEKEYIKVAHSADLLDWLEKGYRLRMSNKESGIISPSLIEPGKIYRPVVK